MKTASAKRCALFGPLLWIAGLLLVPADPAVAKSLVLTGVGGGTTVTVELNSEDFVYAPVANPIFHLFDAIRDVPIVVDRGVNGLLPDVAPINEFTALELTGSGSSRDQISMRSIVNGSARTLVSFSCDTNDCFDGDVTPFDSVQLLDLFEDAVTDTSRWSVSTALSSVHTGNSSFSFGPLEWSVFNPDAPETVRIEPVFDVAYELGETPVLIEGEESLRVGGFAGSPTFPEHEPILEFSLDDIPRGAEIISATLELDTFVSSGAPRIEIIGYAADGVPTLRDGTVRGPVLAESPPTTAGSDPLIELDPIYIESLLSGADHVGLRLRSLDTFDYVGFDATEETFINSTPPTLIVEYTFDGLEGDFNGDQVIDAGDYTVWRDGRGPAFNLADQADWTANYGLSQAEPAASQAAVPEPTALLAALTGVALGLSRRS